MKAETLKKAILQYAMQGKLVEQDPKDEPASVLLERIKAEKEHLIKDGKIKKEKPLPPIIEDEIPYEQPKGWEWTKLSDITYSVGNKYNQIQTSEILKSGEIPVVSQGQNLIDGYSNDKNKIITDIPLIMFGDHTKNVKYINFNFVIGADGTKFHKCIFVDSKYIYYWMLFTSSLLPSRGYARHYSLLKEKSVPLPPLAEQERIVEKLEQILPLVEEYGKNEEKLSKLNSTLPDKIKQSILQHAVQGKLVPQNPDDEPASVLLNRIKAEKEQLIKDGKIKKEKPLPPITEDEIPYELPNGWEWVRFSEVFDVRDGTHDSPKSVPNGIPLITSKDFNNGKIDFSNAKLISKEDHDKIQQRSFVEDDDILYSMIGGNIGNMVMVKKDRDFSIKNVALFKYYSKELSNPQFLKLLLSAITIDFKNKAFGGAQQFVSLTFIRSYVIALPPLAEQQRIVTKVEELLNIVDKLKK